ncbi:MAG: hypothetical protein Q8Q09_00525 [Deltaproteobacteria bacterium]|nr:hypothetical protein [Deltaproteobacteria bacterium]
MSLGFGTARAFVDRGVCVQRLRLACTQWQSTPDANVTTDALRACGTQWQARVCADAVLSFGRELLGCQFSPGNRLANANCASDAQCASLSCSEGRGSQCGRCASSGLTGITTQPNDPCVRGTLCSQGQECIEGRCRWSSIESEPCGTCVYSSPISCVSGRCLAQPIARAGASCGNVSGPATERPLACEPGADCVNRNDFGAGRCGAFLADGAPCTGSDGAPCQFPAQCLRGRCTLPSQDCR